MVRYKEDCPLAAPILIDWSMTNFSAWVGGNWNRIKSKMAARYREKRTSITTVRDQYLSYATFPTPLIFHYSLPLSVQIRKDLQSLKFQITFVVYKGRQILCRWVPINMTRWVQDTVKRPPHHRTSLYQTSFHRKKVVYQTSLFGTSLHWCPCHLTSRVTRDRRLQMVSATERHTNKRNVSPM